MSKYSLWSVSPDIPSANSSSSCQLVQDLLLLCSPVIGSTWWSSGSQPAVGLAGLCYRAVHQTGRRLKAFEGVNTIFWQSMKENEAHKGKLKGKSSWTPLATRKQPPRGTRNWEPCWWRWPTRRLTGEKVAWLIYLNYFCLNDWRSMNIINRDHLSEGPSTSWRPDWSDCTSIHSAWCAVTHLVFSQQQHEYDTSVFRVDWT